MTKGWPDLLREAGREVDRLLDELEQAQKTSDQRTKAAQITVETFLKQELAAARQRYQQLLSEASDG